MSNKRRLYFILIGIISVFITELYIGHFNKYWPIAFIMGSFVIVLEKGIKLFLKPKQKN